MIKEDAKSAEIIRPLLRGRDIKRYFHQNSDLWIIYVPWHFPLHDDVTITGSSDEAENCFKKLYPAVYKHLYSFKDELSARNKAETGIRYEWYALQRWGSNYKDDFFKQKLIFQEMVQEPSFCYDLEGEYFCLDTARIITGRDLEVLLGILNSKLFFYSIKNFYGGGGLGETGVRMKHTFFEKFPAPLFNISQKEALITLVKNILLNNNDAKLFSENTSVIDQILFDFYELSSEEINYINKLD